MSIAIHKDFHGALSCILKHLYERYGEADLIKYLKRVARNVYSPLIEELRKEGLSALERHWRMVFTEEEAEFEISYVDSNLVLKVKRCPAIHYMKKRGYSIFEKFCEHTNIINQEICQQAGYNCKTTYNQNEGRCIQEFWKDKEGSR